MREDGSPSERRVARRALDRGALTILAIYALLGLVVIPIYPHFVSPNEFSRWLLDASIVQSKTIEVTRLAPLFGSRFEDLAQRSGRLYSNKAPGTALVTLPASFVAHAFTHALRPTLTAMRLFGATAPVLALGLLFGRIAGRYAIEPTRVRT